VAFRFGCFALAPTDAQLDALRGRQSKESPTFRWLGATMRGERVPGYDDQRASVVVGEGDAVWERAKDALSRWRPQRGAGLDVYPPDARVEPGATVLVVGKRAGVAMVAACRVTTVIDEPARYGFVYATLPVHPECGEEAFILERSEADVVRFELHVLSALHDPVARVGGPVSRRVQRAATRRYVAAMRDV
jgi:uncharacterized protein (UPF0548 family)